MFKSLRIVFTGVFVSFIGALPLGTTNIAATQIAITDGEREALLFSAGLIIADVFYIYLTLLAMRWIQKQKRLFKALEWLTLTIVFSLAAANFYAALHPAVKKNVILDNALPRFWLGLFLNGLNPLQIPFWFGWSTVLFTKKALLPKWNHYHLFVVGASVGFAAALLLFVFGGRFIGEKVNNNQEVIYYAIGAIFLATGLVQIWKMIKKKDAANRLDHPEKVAEKYEKMADDVVGKES